MRLIGILVFGVQRQVANAPTDSDYYPEVLGQVGFSVVTGFLPITSERRVLGGL